MLRCTMQVYCLADRYEVPGSCMEPIVAALSALKAEDVDLALLSEAYSMLAGLQEAPPLANLMAACQESLLALFSDVPAVIINDERRRQFCALPHAAVLSWLKADNLKVSWCTESTCYWVWLPLLAPGLHQLCVYFYLYRYLPHSVTCTSRFTLRAA